MVTRFSNEHFGGLVGILGVDDIVQGIHETGWHQLLYLPITTDDQQLLCVTQLAG